METVLQRRSFRFAELLGKFWIGDRGGLGRGSPGNYNTSDAVA